MESHDLRDKAGRLIGRTKTLASGRLEIRDRAGRLCGTYDPKTDATRDKTGALVGKGNLLTTLLPDE